MLDYNNLIFLLVLFILLNSQFMYKITNILTMKYFNILTKNGCPTYIGIGIHALIFCIATYYYFKIEESFQEEHCPPGYKLRPPEVSYAGPRNAWCAMKDKKDNDDDQEEEDEEEAPKDQVPNLCDADYTSTKEKGYFINRKSWCRMKNKDDNDNENMEIN